jgi:hypothetical protein
MVNQPSGQAYGGYVNFNNSIIRNSQGDLLDSPWLCSVCVPNLLKLDASSTT